MPQAYTGVLEVKYRSGVSRVRRRPPKLRCRSLLVRPGNASATSEAKLEEAAAIAPPSGRAEAFANLMEMGADGEMPESAVTAA